MQIYPSNLWARQPMSSSLKRGISVCVQRADGLISLKHLFQAARYILTQGTKLIPVRISRCERDDGGPKSGSWGW
jgi:hypothetical protein